jgi:enoyl-CoA hydratase/carnithine racemase
MMSDESVTNERNLMTGLMRTNRDGVAWLALDRPDSRNALSTELLLVLQHELASVREDSDTRVVVLSGTGSAFCSGADIKEFGPDADPESGLVRFTLIEAVLLQLRDLPQPTIAAVNGAAIGAGWGLALACDLCLTSAQAKYSIPELAKGLRLPAVIVHRLTQIVGPVRAASIVLEGRVFDGRQAMEWGWATGSFEDRAELTEHAWRIATELASKAPRSLAAITQSLRSSLPTQASEYPLRED